MPGWSGVVGGVFFGPIPILIPSLTLRCLIAEPQALVRAGLVRLVKELGDLEVLEAGSVTSALVAARATLDLAILDVDLPGGDRLTGLRTLRSMQQPLPIVLIAAQLDGLLVAEAIRAGAQGVIPKSASPELFLAALRFVLACDGPFVPIEALDPIKPASPREDVSAVEPARPVPAGRGEAGPDPVSRLTGRQRDVLALIARGRSNREIGEALGIAEGTAKLHVASVLKTLGVQNRTEAALLARNLGEAGEAS